MKKITVPPHNENESIDPIRMPPPKNADVWRSYFVKRRKYSLNRIPVVSLKNGQVYNFNKHKQIPVGDMWIYEHFEELWWLKIYHYVVYLCKETLIYKIVNKKLITFN